MDMVTHIVGRGQINTASANRQVIVIAIFFMVASLLDAIIGVLLVAGEWRKANCQKLRCLAPGIASIDLCA